MKILISAYSCETGRGSEGEIAWQCVNRLAKYHDVYVITRRNNRAAHAREFESTPKPDRLSFIYFDLPSYLRFYKKGGRFFLIYYYFWQIGIAFLAHNMAKDHKFDILHHLVGGMDWMPSGLAFVRGTFVWGPIGSENTDPAVRRNLTTFVRFKDILRSIVRSVTRNVDPSVRFTGSRAKVIFSHTPENIPLRYKHKVIPFVQTGIADSSRMVIRKTEFERKSVLRIVFAGDLKEWKGARMAVEAALLFFEAEPHADMHVVGDGSLRKALDLMIRSHPFGDRVKLVGRVSMEELKSELYDGDIFIYPSFHHGLSTIVLQAMLTGLPVVCIEGDATARTVTNRAGISVSLTDVSKPASALSKALIQLSKNEPLRQHLAKSAQSIAVNKYSYDSIVESLDCELRSVYAQENK